MPNSEKSIRPTEIRIFIILYVVGFVFSIVAILPHFSLLIVMLSDNHPFSRIVDLRILVPIIMLLPIFTMIMHGIMVYSLKGHAPQDRKRIIIVAIIGAVLAGLSVFNIVGLVINAVVVYYMTKSHMKEYFRVHT
jgi:hypothetical protein